MQVSYIARLDPRLARPLALSLALRVPLDFAMLGVEPEMWIYYAATKPACYAFSVVHAFAQLARGCSKVYYLGHEERALAGLEVEYVDDAEVEIDLSEVKKYALDVGEEYVLPLKSLELPIVRRLYAVGALYVSGGLLVPSRGLAALL